VGSLDPHEADDGLVQLGPFRQLPFVQLMGGYYAILDIQLRHALPADNSTHSIDEKGGRRSGLKGVFGQVTIEFYTHGHVSA
jgi:hypothetical protein